MINLLNELKYNLDNLVNDITNSQECYPIVSITKWCIANEKDVPTGVKRWLSRYSKAISLHCGIEFCVKGEMKNNQRYDNTEFHPSIIQFVYEQYCAGTKRQKMIEGFEKIINSVEDKELELFN